MNFHHCRPFVFFFFSFVLMLLLTAVLAVDSLAQPAVPPGIDPQPAIDSLTSDLSVRNRAAGANDLASTSVDAVNVEVVGQIGGAVDAVTVLDNYAYVGQGPRIIILDISNPSTPIVMGQTPPMPGIVQDIIVEGDYAYVAAGEGGLRVINVSTKSAPVETSSFDTPGSAEDLSLNGNFVYVADYTGGLYIVDISNPDALFETGYYESPGFARGVAVSASYAYIADDHLGLRIVDVTSPSTPVEVGFFDTPELARDVAVVGSYAYVADGFDGLRIIDVSSPTNPSEVGFYDTPGFAYEVVVEGNYAYVADNHGGLLLINISDSTSPSLAANFYPGGFVRGVTIASNHAYLANHDRGLRIVNVANPSTPFLVGSYVVSGTPTGLALDGNYAYVAGENRGLMIIDISDPSNPIQTGSFDYGYAHDVAIAGDFAYVASATGGLRIINISNPANPFQVSSYNTSGWSYDVDVAGNYAYVADWDGDLRIIDITDPFSPFEVGYFTIPGDAFGITVNGDYAYLSVGNDSNALHIVDVSNPTSPSLVTSIDPLSGVRGVTIEGVIAYVADNSGLRIIDIADPAEPGELGSFQILLGGLETSLSGNFAHLAAKYNGLRIINVADPVAPTEIASYDTSGYAYGVVTDGNYSYVADGDGGLIILQNNVPGSITITNQAEPTDTTNFNFDGDLGSFSLQDGESQEFAQLTPGDYVVREANSNEWTFDHIDCGPANVSEWVDRVIIHLEPGEDIVCTFVNQPRPPVSEEVDFIGHIGGASFATAVQGSYAYYGEGPQLVIVDISDPLAATTVSKTLPLEGVVGAIAMSGDYAYVATRHNGLTIIDISTPENPVVIGHLHTAGDAMDVAVAGTTAYLADSVGGMIIIDVSDPTAPRDVGSFGLGGEFFLSVAADGDFAYYTDGWRLSVVDTSTPAVPIEVGHIEASAEKITLVGSYIYVAGGTGLRIIDISDPSNPVETAVFPTSVYQYDVAIAGSFAYIADSNFLTIVDISDPANPLGSGQVELPSVSRGVATGGNYAYLATDSGGLRIIDVTDPVSPIESGFFNAPSLVLGAAVSGNFAHLASGPYEGLSIVDVVNPAVPEAISSLDTNYAYRTVISGTLSYVADGNGLRIVDTSDPNNPVEAGFIETPGRATDVVLQDNYAYVALWWNGLFIVDISDPAAPAEVGFYSIPSGAAGLAISGDYVYVAANYGGLRIIDISDPGAPFEAGNFITQESVGAVAVSGTNAYLGSGFDQLVIVDVSDPGAVQELGIFDTGRSIQDLAIDGTIVYATTYDSVGSSGLLVLNVANPAQVEKIGHYNTAWIAHDLFLTENAIYLTDGWGGLYILRYVEHGSIRIEKEIDVSDTTSFSFIGDLGIFSLSKGTSEVFNKLDPGDYTINEEDAAGWYLDDVRCDSEHISKLDSGITIHLEAEDDITCTFSNRRLTVEADAGGPYTGDEGEAISLDGSGSSHEEMITWYRWDCTADGSWDETSRHPDDSSCTYADNGTYTLRMRTVDIFHQTNTDTVQVKVDNVAPDVDAGDDQTAVAGTEVRFAGSYYDPGTADTHTIKWDFGDGSTKSGTLSPTHIYPNSGQYKVTLTVTDKDGGKDSAELTVDVVNSAPMMSDIKVNPAEINEGEIFILSGSISDSSTSGGLSLFVDWGDGHTVTKEFTAGIKTFSLSHLCVDDAPSGTPADSFTINLKLSDEEGAFTTSTAVIKVNNVAPSVDAGPDQDAITGQSVVFSAAVTDPGLPDTHTVTWDFGDGSPPENGAEITHSFSNPGEFTVTVIVKDDDGGIGQDTLNVTISEMYHIFTPLLFSP